MGRPSGYASMSNTRLVRTEPGDEGFVYDVYERSPAMQTYLVKVVVARYGFVESTSEKVSIDFVEGGGGF